MSRVTRNLFTIQEDNMIKEQYEKEGDLAFEKLAKKLKRAKRIIKNHYQTCLANDIDTTFNEEDDKYIISCVNNPNIGRKWKRIASDMKGKTDSTIKSRYDVLMRKLKNEQIKEDGSRTKMYYERKRTKHRKKVPSNFTTTPLDQCSKIGLPLTIAPSSSQISNSCSNPSDQKIEVDGDFLEFFPDEPEEIFFSDDETGFS